MSKVLTSSQDYSNAAANADQQWLASKGITLTNFYGVGHTSQPNYCAAASGDNYGMDNGECTYFQKRLITDCPEGFSSAVKS